MKNLYDSALTKIVNLENKIAELENTINNFSENIVSETRDLKVQRDNALAKIKELETEITKLTEQVTYLEIDLKQWVERSNKHKTVAEDYQQKYNQAGNDLLTMTNRYNKLKTMWETHNCETGTTKTTDNTSTQETFKNKYLPIITVIGVLVTIIGVTYSIVRSKK